MNRLLLLAGISLGVAGGTSTADDTDSAPPPAPSPRFFGKEYIDYWNSPRPEKAESPKTAAPSADPSAAQKRWSEPAVSEDGSIQTYHPPKQVAELLENPTEENARAYLDWQRERMRRIQEAQRILEEVKLKLAIEETSKRIKQTGVSTRLDLYVQKGCPHCETQKSILAEFVQRMPEVAVRTVELTENPKLVRELSIESVPTMVLSVGQSSVRRASVLSQSQLVRLIGLLVSRGIRRSPGGGRDDPEATDEKE